MMALGVWLSSLFDRVTQWGSMKPSSSVHEVFKWLRWCCMYAERILLQLFVGTFSLVDLAKHVMILPMINAHIL